jgi:hypothetical protein
MGDANLYRAMGNALTDGIDPSGLEDIETRMARADRRRNPPKDPDVQGPVEQFMGAAARTLGDFLGMGGGLGGGINAAIQGKPDWPYHFIPFYPTAQAGMHMGQQITANYQAMQAVGMGDGGGFITSVYMVGVPVIPQVGQLIDGHSWQPSQAYRPLTPSDCGSLSMSASIQFGLMIAGGYAGRASNTPAGLLEATQDFAVGSRAARVSGYLPPDGGRRCSDRAVWASGLKLGVRLTPPSLLRCRAFSRRAVVVLSRARCKALLMLADP